MLARIALPLLAPDDPGSGGGGGAPDWRASLPEDVRSDPTLQSVSDVPTLAKNYINAQRLIGTKRLPAPDPKWGDKEWGDFYTAVGRPESPDKYTNPEPINGVTLEPERLKAAKEFFHKQGLTDRQAKGILEYYGNVISTSLKARDTQSAAARDAALMELRNEFGEKTDAKLDVAKGVLKKFGSPELLQHLESAELGNNTHFVKALVKIGEAMLEDSSRGSAGMFDLKDSTRAIGEIKTLTMDADFMRALNSNSDPGHQAAVERWSSLHTAAYPNKMPAE